MVDGEVLKIDPIGRCSKSTFDTKNLSAPFHTYRNWPPYARFSFGGAGSETHDPYVSALKSVAHWFGFTGDDVEMMLADGFTLEEIEEMFYDGYLLLLCEMLDAIDEGDSPASPDEASVDAA